MLYFIYPKDETTEFLEPIYLEALSVFGEEIVTLISFEENSYEENFELVRALPSSSNIIFLGHGRNNRLYGLFDKSYTPFVESNKMWVFNEQNLFALACKSTHLLTYCFHRTSISHSIGFGNLPTSTDEVDEIKKIKHLQISDDDIEEFKSIIVEVVSLSIIKFYKEGLCFSHIYKHLRLLLNIKMNNAVLINKNRNLAELVFQMLADMSYLRSIKSPSKPE
jgi:hypothetical protein